MTSLAQQLSEIADKKNAEKAEKEVSEMYDYIVARAQNVARTTFKWFTIKMFDMHKELGYVDFLKERERGPRPLSCGTARDMPAKMTGPAEDTFDPYHIWLGIPPQSQPPHHYCLLGISAFESNPDVISNAADQRMAHLRSLQTGRHTQFSQKLLNEVAAARVCLLHPEKKAKYDDQLQEPRYEKDIRTIAAGGVAGGILARREEGGPSRR